jgi:1-pyrroline-4-hydroxy-2-carboxylate deaminase
MADPKYRPHGVLVPMVTPTIKGNGMDAARFGRHLTWLARRGVDGVVIAGTTGEGHRIRKTQKFELIEAAVAARKKLGRDGFQIIVGTGSHLLMEAEAISAYAREMGCDAVLALPPRTDSQRKVSDFYRALRRDVPRIGILAYNIPHITNAALRPVTVGDLVARGTIMGVKDSSQDTKMLGQWKAANPDTLLAVGSDSLIYHGRHEVGAEAVISGIGNIEPKTVIEAFRSGGQQALLAQRTINLLNQQLSKGGRYIHSLKERLFVSRLPEDGYAHSSAPTFMARVQNGAD